jgi:integrase
MTPLKAMLSEAYEFNVTPINAGKVRVIVHADEGRVRRTAPKTLTREQIAAVLDELRERDRLLFYTLARTGLRIGEVLGLKWCDLENTDDGPVLVVGRQHSRGELRDEVKTEAGHRRVAVLWRAR